MDKEVLFNEILRGEKVTTLFQPIVSLSTGDVIGYEALSRGPEDSGLNSPVKLLEEARKNHRLSEIESLFREKAIAKAEIQQLDKQLFINIEPEIICDFKLKNEIERRLSKIHGIPAGSIVLEITQNAKLLDFEKISLAVEECHKCGFSVSFDNIGANFSNLLAVFQMAPDYIKIDQLIIRNIDKSSFKQSIVKSLTVLAGNTNIKLVAQGIETNEEMETLIRLGVYAGQGFYLGMPCDKMGAIDKCVVLKIRKYNNLISGDSLLYYHIIGEICEPVKPFDENEKCIVVKNYLEENQLEGVCVLTHSKTVAGIVMKRHVDSVLSRQNGYELYANKPIRNVMDGKCIVVDYNVPIQAVAEQVFARNRENTYDNIIVTKNNAYAGTVTVIKILKYSMEIERKLALELNPLTGLPGNFQIYNHMDAAIRSGRNLCILYFDLNNFKVYNDVYGFERGDSIIRMTKSAICDVLKAHSNLDYFLGHIGGDDFVAVIDCKIKECIEICEEIIRSFDKQVIPFFNEKDRKNGFICGRDRYNNNRFFPLTRISVSGVFGCLNEFGNSDDLAQYISKIKKIAKETDRSAYVIEKLKAGVRFSSIDNYDQI